MDSTTNLLGALALAIADRVDAEMMMELNRSGASASALVFLGYVPGLSVQVLSRVLQLSHPGTVRLIDRLEEDGHVERRECEDGRAVALHLTRKGKRLRERLMQRRLDVLEPALDILTKDERRAFGNLLAKVLSSLPENELDKHHICRLCSVGVCSSDCPIPGNAPILDPYRKTRAHGE